MKKQRMYVVQQRTRTSRKLNPETGGWYVGYSIDIYVGRTYPFFLLKKEAEGHRKWLKNLFPSGSNKYGYDFRVVELVEKN
jgi:hypothetical protein